MPSGFQLQPRDPTDPAQLQLQADSTEKIIFLDANDGVIKVRDDAGVDVPLGGAGSSAWNVSSVKTQADSPYTPAPGELVRVNPVGTGGVEVALPDPSTVSPGVRIGIKNVTDTENPDAPFGSDDTIGITTAAGNIDGIANGVMTTLREFKVYVSDGISQWMQMG